MTLHLTLKKQWFDMTKAKIKREEYRDIKPYWISRLMLLPKNATIEEAIRNYDDNMRYDFDKAQLRNGYSKNATTIDEEIDYITIGTGRPEWGAEPGKLYFVIKYKH